MCTHSLDTCFSSGATSAQENLNSFLRDPPTAAGWKPINQEVHQDKCVQNFLISEFKKQNQEKGKSPVGFCHLRLGFLSQILSSLKSLRYDLASLREHFFVCFVLVFGGCQGLFFFFFLSLFKSSSHSPEILPIHFNSNCFFSRVQWRSAAAFLRCWRYLCEKQSKNHCERLQQTLWGNNFMIWWEEKR